MARWFRLRFADGMIDALGVRGQSWLLAPGAEPVHTGKNVTWVDDGHLHTGKPVGSAWGTDRRVVLGGGQDDLGRWIKSPRLYDQIPTSYFGVVATERITEAVRPEVATNEVEFLPIAATLPSREVITCYLWNVLNYLPCLHRVAAAIEYLPPKDLSSNPYALPEPRMVASVVSGRSIVRDPDAPQSAIYVSERVVRAIESAKGTGFAFEEMTVM